MRRNFVSFFVFLGVALLTVFGYQLWQTQQLNTTYADVIELSQSSTIQVLEAPSGTRLVPQGVLMTTGDVTELTYTYLIRYEESDQFDVSVADVIFTKNNINYFDEDGMLQFDLSIDQLNSTSSRVTVRISLNMPETEDQYQLLSNSTASFRLQVDRV
ncbi:MAG: hypothetical protein JXB08_02005 [Bacilli bacterium]|nr:hypothetical protein [Bacilli bacterium]MBN2877315.1 hypothetical protein [Bacilli bacterium]